MKSISFPKTSTETKTNGSSIILDLQGSDFKGFVKVYIIGQNGDSSQICTNRGDYFYVEAHKKYALYNNVYESGYRSVFLKFLPVASASSDIRGSWCPNSSSDSGCVILRRGYSDFYNISSFSNELNFRLNSGERYLTHSFPKSTSSSIFLHLENSSADNQPIQVRILGRSDNNSSNSENCNNECEYYEVFTGMNFLLFNKVNEKGCNLCQLEFHSNNGVNIGGWWNPDSQDDLPLNCTTLTGKNSASQTVSQKGNTSDAPLQLSLNGGGCVQTELRDKMNSSCVYLNLTKCNFPGTMNVQIIGASDGNEINCTNRCDSFQVSSGNKYCLYNKVNELHLNKCLLRFTSPSSGTISGVWSPDSAPEGGCITLTGSSSNRTPGGKGTTSDEHFQFTLNAGASVQTNLREKMNFSSVYLNLVNCKFPGSIKVQIIGNDRTEINCTNRHDFFVLNPGAKYFLYNKVKEMNCSACRLRFSSSDSSGVIEGCWSPDSIQEPGCLAITGINSNSVDSSSHPKGNSGTVMSADKAKKLIKVPYFNQLNIPSGCEGVSTAMILNYYGINISGEDFIKNNLIIKPWIGNEAPDPNDAFIGDPYEPSGPNCGYGCYAPCIEKSLRSILFVNKKACVINGKSVTELCSEYIDKNIPVLIWATINMLESYNSKAVWTLNYGGRKGKKFTWVAREHCLVLVGYNDSHYFVNDPYQNNGVLGYEKGIFEKRYQELGSQALVILENKVPPKEIESAIDRQAEQSAKIEKEAIQKAQNIINILGMTNVTLTTCCQEVPFAAPFIEGTAKVTYELKRDVDGILEGTFNVKDGKLEWSGKVNGLLNSSVTLKDEEISIQIAGINVDVPFSFGKLSLKKLNAIGVEMFDGTLSFSITNDGYLKISFVVFKRDMPINDQKLNVKITLDIKLRFCFPKLPVVDLAWINCGFKVPDIDKRNLTIICILLGILGVAAFAPVAGGIMVGTKSITAAAMSICTVCGPLITK